MSIERAGGLSVLAFMLINTFPSSQYFTERGGVILHQWKKKKKLGDQGKRETGYFSDNRKGGREERRKSGNERQRKGQRSFDVELVWLW